MEKTNYLADSKQLTQETIEGKELDSVKVQGIDNDNFTTQLFQHHGIASNLPIDTKVIVIPFGNNRKNSVIVASKNYNIKIVQNAGETTIFSTDSDGLIVKASIKLDDAGEIILNEGTDYAVAFEDLKIEFEKLQDAWDTFAAAYVPGSPVLLGTPPTASPSGSNIDNAKVDEVRIP